MWPAEHVGVLFAIIKVIWNFNPLINGHFLILKISIFPIFWWILIFNMFGKAFLYYCNISDPCLNCVRGVLVVDWSITSLLKWATLISCMYPNNIYLKLSTLSPLFSTWRNLFVHTAYRHPATIIAKVIFASFEITHKKTCFKYEKKHMFNGYLVHNNIICLCCC